MSDWKNRWEQEMIGWHNTEVNPHLKEHHDVLQERRKKPRILVPLCGKSLDIRWLATEAKEVIGVELVQKAIDDFYQEQAQHPQQTRREGLTHYSHENVHLVCANIFDASSKRIGFFDSIYDRAALVALPLAQRQKYADHCLSLLKPEGSILLITYDSPAPETQGPPFPIKEGIVPTLYKNATECTLLGEHLQKKEDDPRLQKRNLDWSRTCIWKIIR